MRGTYGVTAEELWLVCVVFVAVVAQFGQKYKRNHSPHTGVQAVFT